MDTELEPYVPGENLRDAEDAIAYIDALLEDDDPKLFIEYLQAVAKSHGMTALARKAGLSRQGLYKALKPENEPQWSTVMAILKALGLSLSVKTLEKA